MKYKNIAFRLFFILLTFMLFSYILWKTESMRFSEDESFSVLDIVYLNFGYFIGCSPNTHLLNSFFLWLEMNVFGVDQIVLRLHSVLSFLVFSWAIYRLSCYINDIPKRYLFVLLITLHPFMIEYFSLARGYALSIAFMTMACCLLYESLLVEVDETKIHRKKYWTSLCAACSVLSCYVMLTFYISILTIYAVAVILKYKKQRIKSILLKFWEEKLFWVFNLIFFLPVLLVVLKLNPSSLQNYWPDISFWRGTIFSVFEMFSRGPNSYTEALFLLFSLLLLVALINSVRLLYNHGIGYASSLFGLLCMVMYLFFLIENIFFNITYVSYRAAIYLYPLMILTIFFAFAENELSVYIRKLGVALLTLLTFFVVGNFIYTFSLSRGIDTAPRAAFKQALEDLDSLRGKNEYVSLGVSRAFPATIYYYRKLYGYSWIQNIGFGYEDDHKHIQFYNDQVLAGKYDYFIIEKFELERVEAFHKIQIVKKYSDSPLLLAKSIPY